MMDPLHEHNPHPVGTDVNDMRPLHLRIHLHTPAIAVFDQLLHVVLLTTRDCRYCGQRHAFKVGVAESDSQAVLKALAMTVECPCKPDVMLALDVTGVLGPVEVIADYLPLNSDADPLRVSWELRTRTGSR